MKSRLSKILIVMVVTSIAYTSATQMVFAQGGAGGSGHSSGGWHGGIGSHTGGGSHSGYSGSHTGGWNHSRYRGVAAYERGRDYGHNDYSEFERDRTRFWPNSNSASQTPEGMDKGYDYAQTEEPWNYEYPGQRRYRRLPANNVLPPYYDEETMLDNMPPGNGVQNYSWSNSVKRYR